MLFQFKVSQLGDCNAICFFKLGNISPQKQIILERTTFVESLVWLVFSPSLLMSYPESLKLCACVGRTCWGGWASQARPEGGLFVTPKQSTIDRGGGKVWGTITPPSPHPLLIYVQYSLPKICFRTIFQSESNKNVNKDKE